MKIAILAPNINFLGQLIPTLESYGHDVELLCSEDDVFLEKNNIKSKIKTSIDWCDVVFFEWCSDLLIYASSELSNVLSDKQVICRTHSNEIMNGKTHVVDWDVVNTCVFVNPYFAGYTEYFLNKQLTTTKIISLGIDLNKFCFDNKKEINGNIGFSGNFGYVKNSSLALDCFRKIHKKYDNCLFYVAGDIEDYRSFIFTKRFCDLNTIPVEINGRQNNMVEWYKNKTYLLNSSLLESFFLSGVEAMASGVIPMIYNWSGSDIIYPDKYLYKNSDDCLCLYSELQEANIKEEREFCRHWVEQYHDENVRTKELAKCIIGEQ